MKLPQILVTTLVATSMVVIEAACSDEPSLEDSSLGASTTTIAAATAATGVKETASSKLAPTTNGAVQRIHLSIPDLVERVRPSVVHIATERFRSDSFGRAVPSSGTGTGFIISEDGHIVTNNHVVEGAAHIVVTYAEGAVADAEIVGLDPQTDLAVLRIDVDGLTPVPLGNSSDLRGGDTVVAVGHALDLMGSPTVTAGVVSAPRHASWS